MLPKNIEV